MYIKQVVTEGFRCYKDRVEADPFSPRHNVIVGANGSGKSNFFAAIQFVLGDMSGGQLRADERKQMLHEGAGAHVMSAYVEIYLDNSDGRLPVERDEVVLKRAIGLKKDEYFLDRKHVTKTEVINLLESAGFSRSNPYNIVPQGKVNLLTTMKDEQRLELLKEVAGTKTYNERRHESLSIMKESANRREKITEMLTSIEKRLQELDAEKEELARYQALDKQRRVAEYSYYDKEQRKARAELDKMDACRAEESERSVAQQEREEKARVNVKEAEKKLKTLASELTLLQSECAGSAAEHKQLLQECARLEVQAQQESSDSESRTQRAHELQAELAGLSKQLKKVEEQLARQAPECAAKVAEAEQLSSEEEAAEARLQQLYAKRTRTQQFSSRQERDKHLKKEVTTVTAALTKKDQQAASLQKQLEEGRAKASQAETAGSEAKQRLIAERAKEDEAKAAAASLREDRDKLTDQRKQLWRKEQEMTESRRSSQAELEKAQRTLQHSMSRSQWEAVAAVKRIAAEKKMKGVLGMLIELFEVDDKFFTAVEVAAGNQLFQVVVDTDETAATMLRELQRANAGRVTFMPLNRLRPGNDPEYPKSEDVIPMLNRLKFEDRLRPAFAQVFRKTLVVRNLEVGSRFSKSHDLDCITLDGDQVNRKGALTGGYTDVRKSRLRAQADMVRLEAACTACEQQIEGLGGEAEQIDQQVTRVLGELKKQEAKQQKAAAAAAQETLDLPANGAAGSHKVADAQKEKALAALRAASEAERRQLVALEEELSADFSEELSTAEEAQREKLQGELRELQKQRVAAGRARAKAEKQREALETELHENLRKREGEINESLAKLSDETARGEGEGSAEALQAAQERLRAIKSRLDEQQREREEKLAGERQLKASQEELKANLASERQRQQDEAKELDRLLSRRGLLQQKQAEFADCIRKLGALPKDAFDEARRSLSSKQLMAEIERCHKALQKLGHVNKKALDQFANFNEQRDKLLERQAEVDEAEASIKELIEHLDYKKDEAMERTFKGVAKHFSEVFRELVPGGSGKLVMKTAAPQAPPTGSSAGGEASAASRIATYSGVSIKVQFVGGGDTQTMQQLSGGQKTMVALCLIFAIQRCDPAPFYIFDEIDANLDAAHRASLAKMIERQAAPEDEAGEERAHTQFITTTFRPELIHTGDKFYGVTHRNKASTIRTIDKHEALRIITEDQSRARQHAGA